MTKGKSSCLFNFFLILIFIAGIGITFCLSRFLFPKNNIKIEENKKTIIKPTYPYQSKPPSQALEGILENISGEVTKQERDKEDWEKISSSSAIVQGEQIKIGKVGKARVVFSDQLNLTLGNNAQIWFVNTIAQQILLEQEDGLITYENTTPFSLKIFNSLIYFEQGSYKMEVDSTLGRFNLNVSSGNAKLSFVDKENETQVHKLVKGNSVKYDSATKTAIIK